MLIPLLFQLCPGFSCLFIEIHIICFIQVDVKFERMLKRPILLSELKSHFLQPQNALNQIALFKQARLSVSPLTDAEFQFIMSLESVLPVVPASPSNEVSQPSKRRKL